MVHPNYPATEFEMEKFKKDFIDVEARHLMEEVRKIVIARKHRAFHPETNAHKNFLKAHFDKAKGFTIKIFFP